MYGGDAYWINRDQRENRIEIILIITTGIMAEQTDTRQYKRLPPIIGKGYYETLSAHDQSKYELCVSPHGPSCMPGWHYVLKSYQSEAKQLNINS